MKKQTKETAADEPPADVLRKVECRAWERYPCDLRSACQPIAASRGHDLSWPAKIRNLSEGGAGIVLERRFEPGVILFLELAVPGSGSSETVMARVIHAKLLAGNQWLLGCAFCRPLNSAKVESLLASSASPRAASAGGRRPAFTGLTAHGTVEGESSLAPLKPGRGQGPVHRSPGSSSGAAPAGQEPSRRGFFRNLKNSLLILENVTLEGKVQEEIGTLVLARLHLWATWPLAEGTRLRLRILDPNGNPVGVRMRVTSCLPDGEQWTVHYELVETPSAEALCLLGFSAGVTA
jgi:hypothetical protein